MDVNTIVREWLRRNVHKDVVQDFEEVTRIEKQITYRIESQKPSPPHEGKQHFRLTLKLFLRQQSGNDELNYLTNRLLTSKDTEYFQYGGGLSEETEYESPTEIIISKEIYAFVTTEAPKNRHRIMGVTWNE